MRARLARLFGVDEADAPRVARAAAAGFCVLGGWFVVRPLRDAMGTLGRASEVQWLMLATLGAMLALTPPLFFAASRLPHGRFVALAYRFFALSLLAFGPTWLALALAFGLGAASERRARPAAGAGRDGAPLADAAAAPR